jgi:uncharacterized protein YggE
VITVLGSARREVQPDGVTWRADAVEVDSEARPAFDRCTARLNQLTEKLSDVGAVTTEAVSVRPERDDEMGTRTGRVEAVGGVRVRADPERAGALAQAAMDAGADRLDGPRFVYDAAEAVHAELLTDAIGDARRKAERLAEAAGRRIARVHAVEEEDRYGAVVELSAHSEPDVRARGVTVTATVKVVFALEA